MNILRKNVAARLSIYTLVVWLLVSCGAKEVKVDPELVSYRDWYFDMVKEECPIGTPVEPDNYTIEFVDGYDDDEWKVGECTTWNMISKRLITIDRKWWSIMPEIYRKELIAHEMTHCFFNEPHSTDPNNFMYYMLADFTSTSRLEHNIYKYLEKQCDASKIY